ncbi:MAG: DUF6057 family protein [Bacteroidales bacterium]
MKTRHISFFIALGICLFAGMQYYGKYHFFFIEQHQLFRYSFFYLREHLFEIGGVASLSADFLMQFYYVPFLGALISTLLLTSVGWCCWKLLQKQHVSEAFSYSGICVILPFILLHLSNHYLLSGSIAFLMMLVSLLLTISADDKTKAAMIPILAPLLYVAAGPVAFFYLLFGAIGYWRLFNRRTVAGWLTGCAATALLAFVSYRMGWTGSIRQTWLPYFYFEPRLQPDYLLFLPYWILGFLLMAGSLLCQHTIRSPFARGGIALAMVALLLFSLRSPLKDVRKDARLKKLDYYAQTGQWEAIKEELKGTVSNKLYMNYLNLALVKQGRLSKELFDFDQRSTESLWVKWNKASHVSALLGEIGYNCGQIAYAQRMIFESSLGCRSAMSGRHLQYLVKTNLIFGNYPVAEKYIRILGQTLFYKKWADKYRGYLYDDSRVLADSELGVLRKGLPESEELISETLITDHLREILKKNPGNRQVADYLGSYLLLSKELPALKDFIETYYGTEVLPVLPQSMQEAVMVYADNDPDYRKRYAISQHTVARYKKCAALLHANEGNRDIASIVNSEFGNTFWYYLIFK